jgi:hypothetical protein
MKSLLRFLALSLISIPLFAQQSSAIKFSANVPPGIHKLDDRLPIEIHLQNVGNRPVYVFGDLEYFIDLFAATADGKWLPREFIMETFSPPPRSKNGFSMIKPGHFLGYVWHENLEDLGIHKAGQYHLTLYYRSNFNSSNAFGLPVWSGQLSTTIEISVSQ